MEKNKITSGNSGKIAAGAYLKKGGKIGGSPNAGKAKISPTEYAKYGGMMKKGGMKKGGMKKGAMKKGM